MVATADEGEEGAGKEAVVVEVAEEDEVGVEKEGDRGITADGNAMIPKRKLLLHNGWKFSDRECDITR